MVAETTQSGFNLETASPLELVRSGIETERVQTILLSSIYLEDALIDEGHADDLAANMQQKRKQLSEIVVRARERGDEAMVYDVIDGFHRTSGKKRNGEKEINAKVLYGCSDEEMFDLRVLAASSVRSVQFPRIVQWITSSFEASTFADSGLTVAQAFAIAVNDSQSSYVARHLSRERIVELKEWVKEKVSRWGRPLSTTYAMLRTVENADPDLVKQVRAASGGKDRVGRITQARLQAVVDAFPGRNNFVAQKAILRVVVDKRLSAEETTFLAGKSKNLIKEGMDEEMIYSILKEVPIEKIVYKIKTERAEGSSDSEEEVEIRWDEVEPNEDELAYIESDIGPDDLDEDPVISEQVDFPSVASMDNKETDGGSDDGSIRSDTPSKSGLTKSHRDLSREKSSGSFARGEAHDPVELQRQIIDLQEALEKAHTSLSENNNGHMETWWRTAPYLTPKERACMEQIFYGNQDMEKVAASLKITEQYTMLLIKSAFVKRHHHDPQRDPLNL